MLYPHTVLIPTTGTSDRGCKRPRVRAGAEEWGGGYNGGQGAPPVIDAGPLSSLQAARLSQTPGFLRPLSTNGMRTTFVCVCAGRATGRDCSLLNPKRWCRLVLDRLILGLVPGVIGWTCLLKGKELEQIYRCCMYMQYRYVPFVRLCTYLPRL